MHHDQEWLSSRLGCSAEWLRYERSIEPAEPAPMQNSARRLVVMLILCAALELLGLLMYARTVSAAEWSPPQYSCIPTLTDFDHAYRIKDAVVAGVFWCDQPDGLQTFWVSGTTPGAITPKTQADALLQIAGKDPEELLERVVVRASTPSEMELVAQIEIAHAPHCYLTGTSGTAAVLTQTAQGTLGPPKLDAAGVGIRVAVGTPVGCNYRLAKETLKRYCSAENLTDSKLRRIEGDAWSACKMERAPAAGWGP